MTVAEARGRTRRRSRRGAAELVADGARAPGHGRDGHRQHDAGRRADRRAHRPSAGRRHRPGHRHRRRHAGPQGRRDRTGPRPPRGRRRRRARSPPWLRSAAWRSRRWPASSSAGPRPGVPVVVDGVIADAALLVAARARARRARAAAWPDIARWSRGRPRSSTHLGLEPLLDLGMRLGEGSGACLALPVVEAAARLLREMATFDARAGITEKTSSGDSPANRRTSISSRPDPGSRRSGASRGPQL